MTAFLICCDGVIAKTATITSIGLKNVEEVVFGVCNFGMTCPFGVAHDPQSMHDWVR